MSGKSTPEQTFTKLYNLATDPATPEHVRDVAKRKMAAWLKRHGKTERDYPAIFAKAAKDDEAQQPPPPPPDPRATAPSPYDIKRFNPASLVEDILKQYVTMDEQVSVISSLWVPFTHLYKKFSIAPRLALTSEGPDSGKSTLRKVMRHLVYRPNRAALSTGAVIVRHLGQGPGTIMLDETDHLDAEARKKLQLIWNLGHEPEEISLLIGGKEKFFNIHAPMLLAGVGGSLGGFLGDTQKSRMFRLDMAPYTEATKPPRNYNLGDEALNSTLKGIGIDFAALNAVYAFLCKFAAEAGLNPNPELPPEMIRRFGDDARGLLSIAELCGSTWRQRACNALTALFEKEKAERPEVLILHHVLLVIDTLERDSIRSQDVNRELLRLDIPEARWNQYRGASGGDYAHALRLDEQATLLRKSGIESTLIRPPKRKPFRGYRREWIVEALRKRGERPVAPDDAGPGRGRLRLITPALGLSLGLATSPVFVTAFSQVPGSVVGAGLPGLVVACGAVLALARRRRRQCTSPAANSPPDRLGRYGCYTSERPNAPAICLARHRVPQSVL
jgi:Protein of unknown function (DUF3631)